MDRQARDLRDRVAKLERQLAASARKETDLREHIAATRKRLIEVRKEARDLGFTVKKLQRSVQQYERQVSELQSELSGHQKMLQGADLTTSQQSLKLVSLEKLVVELQRIHREHEDTILKRDQRIARMQKAIEARDLMLKKAGAATEATAQTEAALKDYTEQIEELQHAVSRQQDRIDELNQLRLDDATAAKALKRTTSSLEKDVGTYKGTLTGKDEVISRLEQDVARLEATTKERGTRRQSAEVGKLKDQLSQLRRENTEQKDAITSQAFMIEKLRKNVATSDAQLREVQSSESALKAAHVDVKAYKDQVSALQEAVNRQQDLIDATTASRDEDVRRIADLEKALATTERQNASFEHALNDRDAQIVQLRQSLAQRTREIEQLESTLSRRDAMLDEAGTSREAAARMQKTIQSYTEQIAALQEATRCQQNRLDNLNDLRAEEAEEMANLRKSLTEVRQTSGTQRQSLGLRAAEIQSLKDALDNRDDSLSAMRKTSTSLASMEEQVAGYQRQVALLKRQLATRDQAATEADERKEEADTRAATLQSSLAGLQRENKTQKQLIERHERDVQELKHVLADRDRHIADAAETEAGLSRIRREITTYKEAVASLQAELNDKQARIGKLQQGGETTSTKIEKLKTYAVDLRKAYDKQRSAIAQLQDELAARDKKLEGAESAREQIPELRQSIAAYRVRVRKLDHDIAQQKQLLEKVQALDTRENDTITALQRQVSDMIAASEAHDKNLAERDEQISVLRESLRSRSAQLRKEALRTEDGLEALRKNVTTYKLQVAELGRELSRQNRLLDKARRLRAEEELKSAALENQLVQLRTRSAASTRPTSIAPARKRSTTPDRKPAVIPTTPPPASPQPGSTASVHMDSKGLFADAMKIDRKQLGARLTFESTYYARGDLLQARESVDKILRQRPTDAYAWAVRGLVAFRQGELRVATTAFENAIKLQPSEANFHNYMGMLMFTRDDRNRATSEFEEALAIDPGCAEAQFNMALVHVTAALPDRKTALAYYKKAIDLGAKRDVRLEALMRP